MTIKIRMGMVVFIAVYEQLELDWEKKNLCSFCLSKQGKLKPKFRLNY